MGNTLTKAVVGERSYDSLKRRAADNEHTGEEYNPYGNAPRRTGDGRTLIAQPHMGAAEIQTRTNRPPLSFTGQHEAADCSYLSTDQYGMPGRRGRSARPGHMRSGSCGAEAMSDTRERGEREKEEKAQKYLREMGVCILGYVWLRQPFGWRCAGGDHYISDQQLEAYVNKKAGEGEWAEGGREGGLHDGYTDAG